MHVCLWEIYQKMTSVLPRNSGKEVKGCRNTIKFNKIEKGNEYTEDIEPASVFRRLSRNINCYIMCVLICSLVPVIFTLIVVVPKTMADDGITTMKEMMNILMDAMNNCERSLENDLAPKDLEGNYYTTYCKGEWDKLTCWPNSPPGFPVSIACPEYIPDFDHSGQATRMCNEHGEWVTVRNSSKVWTDYKDCRYPDIEEVMLSIKNNGDTKIKNLILLYTVGYSCSLVALTFAMIILAYFKRLHCTRNYIHMHLFASFIMRAAVIFVKDRVLYHGSGIMDVRTQSGEGTAGSLSFIETDESTSYLIACKLVMTLFHYFVATNYYWILVEALYLHSLIFVAFFSDKKYLWRFTITGWGVPVLYVVPWAIVRATLDDVGCWDIAVSEYKWIYNGPIVVANVINFLLFLNIIRVLWYKLKERGAVGKTDNKRQYMKLAKSTLVLIPMFGVHAIVFLGMPDNITSGTWWDIRMYFDLFFNSFQGFFVAIIYCFCNGEVQGEFRRTWERFHLSIEIQKGRKDRNRSSVTMLTSFNSSASQQAGPLLGNGRSLNHRSSSNSLLVAANIHNGESKVATQKPKAEKETVFIVKPSKEDNTEITSNMMDVYEETSLVTRPPFIRRQSSILPTGSDVILPIAEERDLEEAFESAMEKQTECPAKSFILADDIIDPMEETDEFDDVISRDETASLRQKRRQHSRRAASEDSGISSLYISGNKNGRNGDCNLSTSDYCGDSEGAVSDDPPQSSDGEGVSNKSLQSIVIMTSEDLIQTTKRLSDRVDNEV